MRTETRIYKPGAAPKEAARAVWELLCQLAQDEIKAFWSDLCHDYEILTARIEEMAEEEEWFLIWAVGECGTHMTGPNQKDPAWLYPGSGYYRYKHYTILFNQTKHGTVHVQIEPADHVLRRIEARRFEYTCAGCDPDEEHPDIDYCQRCHPVSSCPK